MNKGIQEKAFMKNGQKSSLHCLVLDTKKARRISSAHYHDYIEILYGIDCDLTIWIGDKFEKFQGKDICFINPGETHSVYSQRENNKYYVIKFSPEILRYDGQMPSETGYLLSLIYNNNKGFKHIVPQSEIETENTDNIFRDIFTEWNEEKPGYEFAIRGYILKLFCTLLRIWQKNPDFHTLDLNQNVEIINRSIAYINKNLDTVSEAELAAASHISYSHFSRIFKMTTGKSFRQYVIDARINEAKRLLLTSGLSITDIAQKTGFSSASHFTEKFRQATGTTPKKYKNNLNGIIG